MEVVKNALSKMSKTMKGTIICICILLIIYIGFSIYFSNHFYFRTTINGVNVSGKSVEAADEGISSVVESYILELEERGDIKEEIKASDVGLKYNYNGETQIIKEGQNPYLWFLGIFKSQDFNLSDVSSFDDEQLKKYLETLTCFDEKKVVHPQNPTFQYTENGYSIVSEVNGNKVNKDILYEKVSAKVDNMDKTMNLESENCYEKPSYTKESQEVLVAKETLVKYTSSKVTYTFGDRNEVLDGQIIKEFLNVNESYVVTLSEEKVKKYVDNLSNKYDTLGKTRTFTTAAGNKANVSGGDYGWQINRRKETQELIAQIKSGQPVAKQPKYTQTALNRSANDIGNTYVEINLGKQHLWFYKNGALVVEGDVVTGNVSNNTSTPAGIYSLKSKERDAVLRGADYASPVDFWMPFNEGIGLHDASWRSEFGGSIYLSSGSHGCVNSPYYLVKTIYENINEGTPVVCYFD